MLRYGLFVYGNEYDTFPIDIGVVEDELASKKLQLLEDSMLGTDHLLSMTGPSPQLLETLRICFMDKNELSNSHLEHPISEKNKQQVFSSFQKLLTQILHNYPTEIEEDEEQLIGTELTNMMKLIVLYRLSQKKIVKTNLQLVT